MFREKLLLIIAAMGLVSYISSKLTFDKPVAGTVKSIYDFKIPSITGDTIDFKKYKGKTLLIVNTASKCGFTYQYQGLQKLHETYGDRVEVLGFPANNFLWQEPGSEEDIIAFCDAKFGVNFQLFKKISVVGRNKHPLYKWLQDKSGKVPSWNFCKYIINGDGEFVAFYPASVEPLDKRILTVL